MTVSWAKRHVSTPLVASSAAVERAGHKKATSVLVSVFFIVGNLFCEEDKFTVLSIFIISHNLDQVFSL